MDDVIEPQNNGPLQIRKGKKNGWTQARRAAFLTELAYSCNVRRAHAAAGMGESSAFALRRRDPLFAQQWQAALEAGYERLDMALLRRALEVVDGHQLDEREEPLERMTVAQAIDVMNKHRQSVQQGRAHARRLRHVATQEETDAVLLKRIAMVKRQRARRAATVDGGELTPVPVPGLPRAGETA